MKKLVLLSVIFAFILSGCITYHNSVPQDMTTREKVKDNTSVKVLGKTEGKANVTIILGFVLPEYKVGAFDGDSSPIGSFFSFFGGAKARAEKAAVYKSLENYPDADRVLDPTFKTTTTNYIIFQHAESTVQGTAAQFLYK